MKWEDSTSYARGEARVPTAWTLRLSRDVAISVVSAPTYYPGKWFMNCQPWFDAHPLGLKADTTDAKEAQRVALELVRDKVDQLALTLKAIK